MTPVSLLSRRIGKDRIKTTTSRCSIINQHQASSQTKEKSFETDRFVKLSHRGEKRRQEAAGAARILSNEKVDRGKEEKAAQLLRTKNQSNPEVRHRKKEEQKRSTTAATRAASKNSVLQRQSSLLIIVYIARTPGTSQSNNSILVGSSLLKQQ